MKTVGIIPARYGSSRFPGKPLALLQGKPVIQWVYEAAQKATALSSVVVATDHDDIFNCVKNFGGEAIHTASHHASGTDRCAEALGKLPETFDAVINIQGDEPFLEPEQITLLSELLAERNVQIATLIQPLLEEEMLLNPNVVKVVKNVNSQALYFSRSPIPFMRGQKQTEWTQKTQYFRHLGLYGFQAVVLQQLVELAPSKLEEAESLEQLRWLENGYTIHTAVTAHASLAIDTLGDLENAKNFLSRNSTGL